MVTNKSIFVAIVLAAISTVGFADGGTCAQGSCKANDSVKNGDMPLVMEDHDHVKGTVMKTETTAMPNGKMMNMVVRTDKGEEIKVSMKEDVARNANTHIGDRVSLHGRYAQCNGCERILRCDSCSRDGTINLNHSVKTG